MDYQERRQRWEMMLSLVEAPLHWCWAAIEQWERLELARADALGANRSSNDRLRRERFWRMRTSAYFAMVATAKFLRALEDAADADEGFGEIRTRFPEVVTHLRNALEHDDGWGKWAATYPEPYTQHVWTTDGGGWLGGEVDTAWLLTELRNAFDELLALEQSRP